MSPNPPSLNWQKPYISKLQNYAADVGMTSFSKQLSQQATEQLFIKIVDEYKAGNHPLDEMAMLCEILSHHCGCASGVYGDLLYAADIEWYIGNEPEKVEEMVEHVFESVEELRKKHGK